MVAIFARWIAPYDAENYFDYDNLNNGPSLQHWFGVDSLGRDIFSRVLVGAQISLAAGVFAVFIGAAIGTLLGLLAGYYEGWWDRLIMRICDVLFAFPGILLAIAVVAVLGSGIANVIIAVAIYFISAPNLSEPKRKQQVSLFLFSLICGGGIGFYDGFLGAGAGSFYTLCYILLWGYSIDKAQIHSNFINLASNIASILFFIFGGKMIWSLGLVMFAGQSLGARLGATVVLTRGKKVIRPMIVIVSICISVKMLLDMY